MNIVKIFNVKGRWAVVEDNGDMIGCQKVIDKGGIETKTANRHVIHLDEQYRTFSKREVERWGSL